MIRIMHVSMAPATGVACMIRTLAEEQAKHGYDVMLCVALRRNDPVPAWVQQFENAIIRTPRIFGTGALIYLAALEKTFFGGFRRNLKRFQPTVIHFHDPSLAGALLPERKMPGVRIVLTYHGLANSINLRHQPLRCALHKRWMRRAESLADALATVDPGTPKLAEAIFGTNAGRFVYVPNGVQGPEKLALRRRSPRDPFSVGHVGTVDRNKGWWLVGEAVEAARAQEVDVRYIISGRGPEGKMAAQWAQERRDHVKYLEWVDDVQGEVLNRLDAFILASAQEGMPMAVLEAMAAGLPVIATEVGGIPTAIRHGTEGLIVSRDRVAITDAIMKLAGNPDLSRGMARNARVRWESTFSASHMQANYEALYTGNHSPGLTQIFC